MKLALLLILLAPLANAAVMAPPELATGLLAVPLHSRPGASAVAYLDFATVPSTATTEQVIDIWRIVSAAYSPFNIDVTTDFPGYRANVAWAVIGGPITDGHVGIATQGAWTFGTAYAQYSSVFAANVYADYYANDPKFVAQTIIHEDGHLFGLPHEDSGYMYAFVDPDNNAFWTPNDEAFIAGQTGFAPVPEPPVLLAACGMVLMRRGRR
jgi:hypothetical protein